MKCPYCDNEHNRIKWCSNFCKQEFYKANKRKNNAINHKLTKLKCHFCNSTFEPRRRIDEKFCSNFCKIEFHKEQLRIKTEEKRANTTKVCPICDKEFAPKKTMKQIYCTRKCANSIQRRVYSMMRHCYESTETSKSDHAHEVLGYSPSDLLEHLETFPQWKTLRNRKWHLDHKFPIIAFVRKGITDISLICRLDNLQPLAGTVNCKKNDTYDEELFEEWLKSEN